MRTDGIFIGIEVDNEIAGDVEIARKLEDTCPVDIYADAGGRVEIVEEHIDECILCDMCVAAAPDGKVVIHRLYDEEPAKT